MKKIAALLLIFLCGVTFSQNEIEIQKTIRAYPTINSSQELLQAIKRDFKSDFIRVKALYTWITLNITYEYASSFTIQAPEQIVYFNEEDLARRIKMNNDKLVEKTIKTKRGVCKHMALTLQKLCDLLGLENELIKGYVRNAPEDIGITPKYKNHVWNAVKIYNRWVLIDATYGIDYDKKKYRQACSYTYFDTPIDKLSLTHYPSDPKWIQFLEQIPMKRFSEYPMFWNTFLSTEAELISPKIGKLISHKNIIFLTFKDLDDTTKITYKFEGDTYAKKPKIRHVDTFTNIAINSTKKGILTVYFDDESALAFRVVEE
ncbi:transglutaminase domain-containing protein [Tenacibaculum amylolyticum]|uniref:transglutaminase domain-containing protein n=1 Tax=Tenacibaculum amylolyticum TaxID=104269 RepID=UPI00389328C0